MKVLPLAAAAVISGGAGYGLSEYMTKEPDNYVEKQAAIEPEKEVDSPTTQVEADLCPKPIVKVVTKEVPKIVEKEKLKVIEKIVPKIVYKDKIVEKEILPNKKGCFVDWDNKRVLVISDDETHIRCHVNWRTKDVREKRINVNESSRRLY